jgi:CDP-diacylglycerol pyrophosphatase
MGVARLDQALPEVKAARFGPAGQGMLSDPGIPTTRRGPMKSDAIALRKRLGLFVVALISILFGVIAGATAQTACAPHPHGTAMWDAIKSHCFDRKDADSPRDCFVPDEKIVIARDTYKPKAFLVVARDDIAGIETESIRDDGAPNFWLAGWNNRRLVGEDWTVGLAINAECRRSQDRLHIHLDRLCPKAADEIGKLDAGARDLSGSMLKPYHVATIKLAELARRNIFAMVKALSGSIPVADQSIALVAAKNDPGTAYVLYGSLGEGSGHAEDLFSYGGHCG